ncbi:MAG TPA: hypothetical protein VIF64_08575 [Pyrinomonadaceae bacterium]|jgi:hypothetical protein
MNKKQVSTFVLALFLVTVGASQAFAQGLPIYNNIPSPLPGNVAGYGFEASGTSEFGDRIMFAPATGRSLTTVTLTMSSWGCQSGHWYSGDCVTAPGATFSHPITLNIYNVVAGNQVGTLIGSVTQTFAIPYRPSADNVNCTGANVGKWYDASSNTCFNGKASDITFSLSGLTVPNQVIFGVAYNTTHYGYTPIGPLAPCNTSPGGCGYDALNVGVVDPAVYNTVGSNPAPDDAYQYTIFSSCTNGPIIPFGLDAGCWTGFKPSIRFNAANPPLTKDDCKNGGWQTHTTATGEPFKSQGQCVSSTNH